YGVIEMEEAQIISAADDDDRDHVSALELLQAVYQSKSVAMHTRMRAAMACLPFEAPKLLATAIINEQDFATLLDQRIAKLQQMKLIEARPTSTDGNGPTSANENGGSDARLPPPIPDRRFRRI